MTMVRYSLYYLKTILLFYFFNVILIIKITRYVCVKIMFNLKHFKIIVFETLANKECILFSFLGSPFDELQHANVNSKVACHVSLLKLNSLKTLYFVVFHLYARRL